MVRLAEAVGAIHSAADAGKVSSAQRASYSQSRLLGDPCHGPSRSREPPLFASACNHSNVAACSLSGHSSASPVVASHRRHASSRAFATRRCHLPNPSPFGSPCLSLQPFVGRPTHPRRLRREKMAAAGAAPELHPRSASLFEPTHDRAEPRRRVLQAETDPARPAPLADVQDSAAAWAMRALEPGPYRPRRELRWHSV